MPIKNLNNLHLSPPEITKANTALNDLENALVNINVEITPDDRQKYGSIDEQNKLFVNKTADFYTSQPALGDPEVDWSEFQRDNQSRALFAGYINRLQRLIDRLNNAKTLYDYDSYQAALSDYSHTTYKAGRGADGYENKYKELRQFFVHPRKEKGDGPAAPPSPASPL